MSPIDPDQRVFLKASLDNLVRGINVSENVRDCEEVLRESATRADRAIRHIKTRGQTDFLSEQLDYDDLNNVGGYTCSREFDRKTKKTISFSKGEKRLEFIFEKDVGSTDAILDLATSGDEYSSGELTEIATNDFVQAFQGGVGVANTNELLVGASARSLSGYKLVAVNRYSPLKTKWLGFIPITKIRAEQIYSRE